MIVKLDCTSCEIRLCIFYIYLPFKLRPFEHLQKQRKVLQSFQPAGMISTVDDLNLFLHTVSQAGLIVFTNKKCSEPNDTKKMNV